jgi:2-isopropylmalate synthase
MWDIFAAEYLSGGWAELLDHHTSSAVEAKDALSVEVVLGGEAHQIEGAGNGPISAFCDGLGRAGVAVRVLDYCEHALTAGSDAQAAAYVQCDVDVRGNGSQTLWGVGIDANTVTASLKAVISAVNRAMR